jgi:putative addiction module component (TIGR02574 family)
MSSLSTRIPGLSEATVDEKLALIDELWESIRRSTNIEIREDHLQELTKRVAAVSTDPSIALTPSQARALLNR